MLAAICPSEMCGIERRSSLYLPRRVGSDEKSNDKADRSQSRPATSYFVPMAADSSPAYSERPRTEYAVGKLHRETFVTGDIISPNSPENGTPRDAQPDDDDYFHFISTMCSSYSLEQSRRSDERRRQTAVPVTSTNIDDSELTTLRNLVKADHESGVRRAYTRNAVPRPALQMRKRSAPSKTTSALNHLNQTLATDSDSDASLRRIQTAPARSHRATKSMIAAGPRSPRLTIGSMTSHPSSMSSPRTSAKFASAPCSPSSPTLPTGQINQVFNNVRPRSSPRTPRSPRSMRQSLKQEPEPTLALPKSHFSDDSSTEADFVTEFQSSSIAAFLRDESNRGSIKTVSNVQQDEPPSTDTLEAPELTPDAGQTCWFSDTEAEDTGAPAIAPRNPHDVIYWSPAISEDASAGALSIESSEKEDWPLPSPYPRADRSRVPPTMAPLTSIETTSQQHKHTLSAETTATTTTIVSPTFTEHRNSAGHDSASSFEVPTPTAETHKPLEILQDDNASIAPSEMSVQWTQSPKERLGLGGRMRKSAVIPWEMEKSPAATVRRIDTPLVRTKSNRFSAFISRHRTLTG